MAIAGFVFCDVCACGLSAVMALLPPLRRRCRVLLLTLLMRLRRGFRPRLRVWLLEMRLRLRLRARLLEVRLRLRLRARLLEVRLRLRLRTRLLEMRLRLRLRTRLLEMRLRLWLRTRLLEVRLRLWTRLFDARLSLRLRARLLEVLRLRLRFNAGRGLGGGLVHRGSWRSLRRLPHMRLRLPSLHRLRRLSLRSPGSRARLIPRHPLLRYRRMRLRP